MSRAACSSLLQAALSFFSINKIELLLYFRHPSFKFLIFASGLSVYLLWAQSPELVPFSLGEWGRQLASWASVFAPLLGICLLPILLGPQGRDAEMITTFPQGTVLKCRALSVALGSSLAVSAGSALSLVVIWLAQRPPFTLHGGEYLPIYVVYTTLQISFWILVSVGLWHLTSSRWGTIAGLAILWAASHGGTILWVTLPSLEAGGMPWLPWMFLAPTALHDFSPYAPWGSVPWLPLLRTFGLFMVAFAFLSLGVVVFLRKELREPIRAGEIGSIVLTLLLGGLGLWGAWAQAHQEIAPYTRRELILGRVQPLTLYSWDKRGDRLAIKGEFTAFLFPEGKAVPASLRGNRCLSKYRTLVLIYPCGTPYPNELTGLARRVEVLLDRAIWLKPPPQLLLWPAELRGTWGTQVIIQNDGKPRQLWLPDLSVRQAFLARRDPRLLLNLVWELSQGFQGINYAFRGYVSLYLMITVDYSFVQQILELLQRWVQQTPLELSTKFPYVSPNERVPPDELPLIRQELRKLADQGIVFLNTIDTLTPEDARLYQIELTLLIARQQLAEGSKAPPQVKGLVDALVELHPWLFVDTLFTDYTAWLILEYWRRGEKEGHEAFISKVLEDHRMEEAE